MIYDDHGHFPPPPRYINHDYRPLSDEDERLIVSKYLPALPDDHWAKKLYAEVLRLREARVVRELIEGSIVIDEKGGTLRFQIKERT